MKKLYLVLCIALAMLGATACGKSDSSESTKFDKTDLENRSTQVLQQVLSETNLSTIENEEVYESFAEQAGEDIAASYKSFYDTTKELGTYEDIAVTDTSIQEDTASVELTIKYPDEKVIVKCNFDKHSTLTSFSSEEYRTFGQKMVKALLNTVMGMGTVFIVLIFISAIIALLKYVPGLFAKKNTPAPVATVTETVTESVEEELVDDGELVAVITAAIMASMGDQAPEDGLVVRSIRKVNKKWKNA